MTRLAPTIRDCLLMSKKILEDWEKTKGRLFAAVRQKDFLEAEKHVKELLRGLASIHQVYAVDIELSHDWRKHHLLVAQVARLFNYYKEIEENFKILRFDIVFSRLRYSETTVNNILKIALKLYKGEEIVENSSAPFNPLDLTGENNEEKRKKWKEWVKKRERLDESLPDDPKSLMEMFKKEAKSE